LKACGFLACLFLLLLAVANYRAQAGEPVRAASLAGQIGASGAGASYAPAFSADGRFVVFVSQANNLVTNDDLGLNLDVFVRDLAAQRTILVSMSTNGLGGANADANYPSISSNGQFIAFASAAGNLTLNDTNHASDVFLRDWVAGTTTLVSMDTNGAAPAKSAVGSAHPLISADGRWVFFESVASSLVTNADGWETRDVFARDLQAGLTCLVSVNQTGAGGMDPGEDSTLCSITPDGRFAAFVSMAPDLVPGVTTSPGDLYVRDLQAGVTYWASSNLAGFLPNYVVLNGVLSADGGDVVFKARAPSLSAASASVFRYHLQTGVTELLAAYSRGDSWPDISADGRFVAFEVGDANMVACDVYVRDTVAGTNLLVGVSNNAVPMTGLSRTPVLTPDGRRVAFLREEGPMVSQGIVLPARLYVGDLIGATTRLASVTTDGTSAGVLGTGIPALSMDGMSVAFESDLAGLVSNDFNHASDVFLRDLAASATQLISERHSERPELTGSGLALVENDNNGRADIFVRDRWTTNTLVVTRSIRTGGTGGGFSGEPFLGADGQTVIFNSFAGDLAPGDYNDRRDVFVLRLGGPDTDGDGMADDWEMAYFNTLSRDGSGDFDGDGATDLQEFLADTDPTNRGSVLHVLTLTSMGGAGTTVLWAAAPGKNYKVQFKNDLTDTVWTDLSGDIVLNGSTASLLDPAAGGQSRRFYRVVLLP